MLMSTGLPRPVFRRYADCGGIRRYSKVQYRVQCTLKRYRLMQLARGKRELYRVRVVNQLVVLLRMRKNSKFPSVDSRTCLVRVGRAHYATHTRIFFAHVLANSAEGFAL